MSTPEQPHVIDLRRVRQIIAEISEVATAIDQRELDERSSLTQGRAERAELSRYLQLIATRAELIAALSRSEYWTARGYTDHINTTTTEKD